MIKQKFLDFLLTCGESQGKAILETADKSQVLALIFLFHNIVLNKESLSHQSKKLLNKHKKIISRILDKKNSEKRKYSIIRNNSEKFYSIIKSTKKVLLKALK